MIIEPPGPAASTTHAATKDRPIKSRSRRFTLPAHDDDRVGRVVEGLLSDQPLADHPDRGKPRATSGDPLSALVPRLDWAAALQREELRRARYDRPVGIAVIDLSHGRDLRAVRLAAGILRGESRDTDHVTRVGQGRFQVLLPETRERGVRLYIERVCSAWSAAERELRGQNALSVGGAGTRNGESISEALERAIGQLG